jgi:hypothetical protein
LPVGSWAQINFQRRATLRLDPSNCTVHKGVEFLYPIQDSLDLHPAPFALADDQLALSSDQRAERDAPLINFPVFFYPQILQKSQK